MNLAERWRQKLADFERGRIDSFTDDEKEAIRDVVGRIGDYDVILRAPLEAGINVSRPFRGVAVEIENDGTLLYVVLLTRASNDRQRARLFAVGPCRHCGRLAPLVPHIEDENPYEDQPPQVTLGLALTNGEPGGGHDCAIPTAGTGDAGGQYL